jgi:hypothetical protein
LDVFIISFVEEKHTTSYGEAGVEIRIQFARYFVKIYFIERYFGL